MHDPSHPCPPGGRGTDSPRVLAAVRDLNRLELAGETLRAALEALACAAPDWPADAVPVREWAERYGPRTDSWHPPASKTKRAEMALVYGRDGFALLEAVHSPAAPVWLRDPPALRVPRTVWMQNYHRTVTAAGTKVERRDSEDLPPGRLRLASPYDTDAREVRAADPRRPLFVAGDSAGGAMALAVAQPLRDQGDSGDEALIDCLVLISPWLFASMSNPGHVRLRRDDRIQANPGLREFGRAYAGDLPHLPWGTPVPQRITRPPGAAALAAPTLGGLRQVGPSAGRRDPTAARGRLPRRVRGGRAHPLRPVAPDGRMGRPVRSGRLPPRRRGRARGPSTSSARRPTRRTAAAVHRRRGRPMPRPAEGIGDQGGGIGRARLVLSQHVREDHRVRRCVCQPEAAAEHVAEPAAYGQGARRTFVRIPMVCHGGRLLTVVHPAE